MTIFNSKLYFFANDGTSVISQLWVTDGTDTGTTKIMEGASGSKMTVFDSKLYFPAYDATHGVELWATDGTVAGTAMVKDINTYKKDSSGNLVAGSSSPVRMCRARVACCRRALAQRAKALAFFPTHDRPSLFP